MTCKTIYYAEVFDPTTGSYRVGIFQEKETAEAWSFDFESCDIMPKITSVRLSDRRYNYNLEGGLNPSLFRVHWLLDGAQPVRSP